ncbi:hypothetical protein NU10_01490 [Flavobacterium dauae]|uniref:hypothetical protein n=1 Tax=Flavobacterium dauae TaxID=1563479 RepID=UPI00101B32DA|nr:hypothetical protein [Flavobacterium dauae]WLD24094.1 hypothetical protein NU10_01490 [Flavobacterium dauae]
MKKTILLFLTTVFLSLGFSANAQPIELKELLTKAEESLNNINTVVYKVDYFNKYLAKNDTLHSTAICSLYRMPKDKMQSFHRIEFEVEKDAPKYFGQRMYNGEKVLWYSNSVDSLTTNETPEIYSEKKMKYSVVENYSNFLLKQYFGRKDNFSIYGTKLAKIRMKDINVTEENLHNTPVYVLNIAYKDQKDATRDEVTKHYIRKSDFLPIAHYSFLRWENMEQYNYYEIEYLTINSGVSLDDFKIEENQQLNAVELYKDFKNQLKKINIATTN